MADEQDKDKLAADIRSKLAERLAPVLGDPKNRLRMMVAVKVLAIVNREIGQGAARLDSDWANLKETVAAQEGASELVASLEAAVGTYRDELQERIASGEMEEGPARDAAVKVIQLALLKKLGLLSAPAES